MKNNPLLILIFTSVLISSVVAETPLTADIAPRPIVNMLDFCVVANNWLSEIEITYTEDNQLRSPDVAAHQGVAWDGIYYYVIHSTGATYWVKKFDISWTQVGSTYTSIISDTDNDIGHEGTYFYNHLGDGCVYNGKLYITIMNNGPNDGTDGGHSQAIAIINTNDLSYDSAVKLWDKASMTYEVDSIYIDGSKAYIVSYCNNSGHEDAQRIRVWNFPSWTAEGGGGEDVEISQPLLYMQGITRTPRGFMISYGGRYLQPVKPDGSLLTRLLWTRPGDGDIEGLCWRSEINAICVLCDHINDPTDVSYIYCLERSNPKWSGDLNGDGFVNLLDFGIIGEQWLILP